MPRFSLVPAIHAPPATGYGHASFTLFGGSADINSRMGTEAGELAEQLIAAIYVSSAHRPLREDEILEILRVARHKNEHLCITGLLLYREGNFLQVLEGPASSVDAVLDTIERDSRHHGMIVLSHSNIEERQFSDWRMAFRAISKKGAAEKGYSPFVEADYADEESEQAQLAYRLLRRFKQDMR